MTRKHESSHHHFLTDEPVELVEGPDHRHVRRGAALAAGDEESAPVRRRETECTEVGEVIAGTRPGRQSAEEITLFKSVGLAVEDVVTADLVYRKALEVRA